jgi:hypothetical protein
MTSFKELKNWVRSDEQAATLESDVSEAKPLFDRCELFADPIQEALEREKLGTVTGGGSMESAPDDDGATEVIFSEIDVDLYDVANGLWLLQQELIRLQAPQGTILVYELNGQERQDPVYPGKAC